MQGSGNAVQAIAGLSMFDDDDDDLYSSAAPPLAQPQLEPRPESEQPPDADEQVQDGPEDHGDGEGELEEEEDSEDDIEIIMEPTQRSVDFRNQGNRPRVSNISPAVKTNLTTEYTPREREPPPGSKLLIPTKQSSALAQFQTTAISPTAIENDSRIQKEEDPSSLDTSKLPPAIAPPSAPPLNPSLPGTLDGRSIYEMDISTLGEKPWRRPGSDLSDWFNYGFDEISWEAYCFRRREMREIAPILKVNVLTFAGMPEEQINNLPPELRALVISQSAAAGVTAPGVPPGMMPSMPANGAMTQAIGGMMHPDMIMGMGIGIPGGPGGVGPQAMGMVNGVVVGEMSNGTQMQPGSGGPMGTGVGPDMDPSMTGIDFTGTMMTAPQPGMGMDFGIQDPNMQGHMYGIGMEGVPTPRGGAPVPFRGARATPQGPAGRGTRGAFGGRGRGRGGGPYDGGVVQPPVRAASPLPPGVPTGPRNQNRYKDRDGTAGSTDGLDYGGSGGGQTQEDPASSSRKRRGSPGDEGGRSKRR